MKVLKFGGKSLASSQTFDQVIAIIKEKSEQGPIAVVVSAIGDTTDTLENILYLANDGKEYLEVFENFKNRAYHKAIDITTELETLNKIYSGVALLQDYNLKIKDQVLAQGELISSKIIAKELKKRGLKAVAIDSREIFITDANFGNALALSEISKKKTQAKFKEIDAQTIAVVTGFIGATQKGDTTTLGRNGSNYSASLLANFLNAEELQNYTHVDGIFTANPDWVKEARKIEELSFNDANELANFGASILHAKTILPLIENNIPLRILNTLNPKDSGTLISAKATATGTKSLSAEFDVALIKLEGGGLLGTVGVDARIFSTMAQNNINVGVISQGSSERGIGFIVKQSDANKALKALKEEFKQDFYSKDVYSISVEKDLCVISIVGQELQDFDKAYSALVGHRIVPVLFNTAITGKNVSLVVQKEEAKKALNVLHNKLFETATTVHLLLLGHGVVGSTLINQILEQKEQLEKNQAVQLNIFAIANSKKILLDSEGIGKNWKSELKEKGKEYTLDTIIEYAKQQHLDNLIAVDNTASQKVVEYYIPLIKNGFDWVSSNKIANTLKYSFYQELRNCLSKHKKQYLYEANVGAGLPIIDPIKHLYLSGEKITKIKGVFSGSLSYIFNQFSNTDQKFSAIVKETQSKGYTEPDPREDLSGNDVARKLLILAREIGLSCSLEDIEIQNLIPKELSVLSSEEFLNRIEELDLPFETKKKALATEKVLKYVGELSIDSTSNKVLLETKLAEVTTDSSLGQLQGSDNLIEIYTENYDHSPITIQGAGAGAEVTARGVFGDLIRVSKTF